MQEGRQIGELSNFWNKNSPLPSIFNNNYNKTEHVDQIFGWFKINQAKVLNNLRTTIIYLFEENICMMLTYSSVREGDELTSTHKKADFQ